MATRMSSCGNNRAKTDEIRFIVSDLRSCRKKTKTQRKKERKKDHKFREKNTTVNTRVTNDAMKKGMMTTGPANGKKNATQNTRMTDEERNGSSPRY